VKHWQRNELETKRKKERLYRNHQRFFFFFFPFSAQAARGESKRRGPWMSKSLYVFDTEEELAEAEGSQFS
jgi:hypothetical protein